MLKVIKQKTINEKSCQELDKSTDRINPKIIGMKIYKLYFIQNFF
jgi:hypothetical protein